MKRISVPLPYAGVNIRADETQLKAGEYRALSNIELDKSGVFERRPGRTAMSLTPGFHSAYRSESRGLSWVCRGTEILVLDTESGSTTQVFSSFPTHGGVYWTEFNGAVYAQSAYDTAWMPPDQDSFRLCGVDTPSKSPTLTPSEGVYNPGHFVVCITMVDDRGEESPPTEYQRLELPNGGGIKLSGLPSRAGYTLRVYVTEPDGELLREAEEIPAIYPEYTVSRIPTGRTCDTMNLQPLGGGKYLTWYNGRLYFGREDSIRMSEPLRPNLTSPSSNALPTIGDVRFITPVADGIYYGDNRGVWFLKGGDPTKVTQTLVSPIKAFPGSGIRVPGSSFDDKISGGSQYVAVWLTQKGYVTGASGGQVTELHAGKLEINSTSGTSAFIERLGKKIILTSVASPQVSGDNSAFDTKFGE